MDQGQKCLPWGINICKTVRLDANLHQLHIFPSLFLSPSTAPCNSFYFLLFLSVHSVLPFSHTLFLSLSLSALISPSHFFLPPPLPFYFHLVNNFPFINLFSYLNLCINLSPILLPPFSLYFHLYNSFPNYSSLSPLPSFLPFPLFPSLQKFLPLFLSFPISISLPLTFLLPFPSVSISALISLLPLASSSFFHLFPSQFFVSKYI